MAKLTGPLHSSHAGGTLGKQYIFSHHRGKQYVKKYVKPRDYRTQKQAIMRDMLKDMLLEWRTLSDTEKKSWIDAAKNMNRSGYSFWIGKNIKMLRQYQKPSRLFTDPDYVFYDAFYAPNGPAPNWTGSGTNTTIVDYTLKLSNLSTYGHSYATNSPITQNKTFTAKAKVIGKGSNPQYALIFYFQDFNNFYYAGWSTLVRVFFINKRVAGTYYNVATVAGTFDVTQWHEYKIIANNPNFYLYIDGQLIVSGKDTTFTKGKIGISVYQNTAITDFVSIQ